MRSLSMARGPHVSSLNFGAGGISGPGLFLEEKAVKVKQTCSLCGGKGRLPPLGIDGLAPAEPARKDVMRRFERLCKMEDGGCDGAGWRLVEVSVTEIKG